MPGSSAHYSQPHLPWPQERAKIRSSALFPVHPDDPAAAREARPRGTLRLFDIHAYGGFGKTTLAYHYANEYRAFFNRVWRISVESPEGCRYQWEEVRPFFTNRPRLLNLFTYWPSLPKLVIFDNVSPKSETYLREEIKALPRDVRVLMTARRPVQGAHPLNLEGLRPEVAVELLRSKAELGTSRAEIDADIGHHLNEAPAEAEYGKTIHLVVRQSLAQVAANPSATGLAELLPYCAADRIPKSLYSQALSRPETAGDAFDQLWSVALVDHAKEFSSEDTAATMHRVIQAVTRITGDTAATDFAKLASADMRRQDPTLFPDVLRLLYGHPLWSVAESAASVVETLVTDAPPNSPDRQAYIDIVQSLFHASLPWRVRYGATETAYQIRDSEDPNMATFGRAVQLFYGDEVSKLRGLFAENLFSVMLNASDDERVSLEREFDTPIREWLKDNDCWVLDHVHRYFHTLHLRGVNVSHSTSGPPSPLFDKSSDWWTEPRDRFLSAIEDAKEIRPA